jgi:ribulose kinase
MSQTLNFVAIDLCAESGQATTIGNALVQAVALGHLNSLTETREIVEGSFELVTYEPRKTPQWDEAYARFTHLLPAQRERQMNPCLTRAQICPNMLTATCAHK